MQCLLLTLVNTPDPLRVVVKATIGILSVAHNGVTSLGQRRILGGILPVLLGDSSTRINGISHIEVGLIELVNIGYGVHTTVLATLLEQADGLIEVFVHLSVGLLKGCQWLIASALVQTQDDTLGLTLLVAPTVTIDL